MQLDVTITPDSSTVELNSVDDFTSLSVVVGGDDRSETLSRVLEPWGGTRGGSRLARHRPLGASRRCPDRKHRVETEVLRDGGLRTRPRLGGSRQQGASTP